MSIGKLLLKIEAAVFCLLICQQAKHDRVSLAGRATYIILQSQSEVTSKQIGEL